MLDIIENIRREGQWTNFSSFMIYGKHGMKSINPNLENADEWVRLDLLRKVCISYADKIKSQLFKDTNENRMNFCFGEMGQRTRGLGQSFNWNEHKGKLIVYMNQMISYHLNTL